MNTQESVSEKEPLDRLLRKKPFKRTYLQLPTTVFKFEHSFLIS